jgi:hypothetical protein
MSTDYEPRFITNNNEYTIQINILYNNTKDDDITDDDNTSDSLNNNYYIINNMKDILLEEFSNEQNYKVFEAKYLNTAGNPLYIVNDSFYLDTNVMNVIRKTRTNKFPSYGSNNIGAQKLDLDTYYDKFRSSSTEQERNYMLKIFKEIYIKLVRETKPSKRFASSVDNQTIIEAIEKVISLDKLFKNQYFVEEPHSGTREFHAYIKNKYETTQSIAEKKAIQLFYNITNNELSNKPKYEYFLKPETITNIFKVIYENSSIDDSAFGRRSVLNDNRTKEEIYMKYFKYVFPNKKDIANLNDQDKDKILMFYNVYYIIKNIYLLDNTIINVTNYRIKKNKEEKKYYISDVKLLDLKDNITHFKIEKKKVTIFIKATLKFIIETPILKINYLVDDLEDARQNYLPQSYILQPKDLNKNYSNYDKIYIHNRVKYINNVKNIDNIVIDARKKNYIKNNDELFLNTQALKLFNKYFKLELSNDSKKKITETEMDNIIESNIKYLIHKTFKLYNNIEFKKYYIADTYIQYFNDNNTSKPSFYSITKGNIVDSSEKYQIITSLFAQSYETDDSARSEEVMKKSIFKEIKSPDARLRNNKIYKINLVLRCYFDKTGKKPTIMRKIVAEKCLSRAQILDEAFTKSLYKTFNLPENYLYNKLANITRKQKPNVVSENNMPQEKILSQEKTMSREKNMPIKIGGKVTKKYNHNKNKDNIIFTNNNIYQ